MIKYICSLLILICFVSGQKPINKNECLFQPNDVYQWNMETMKFLLNTHDLTSHRQREKRMPPRKITKEEREKSLYPHDLDNDISTIWLFLNNRGKLLSYINESILPNEDEVIEIFETYIFFKDPTFEIIYKDSITKVTIHNDGSITSLVADQKSEMDTTHIDIRGKGGPVRTLTLYSIIHLDQNGIKQFETLSSYIDSSFN